MNVEDNLEIGISLLISIGYAYVVYSWSKKWNNQFPENSKRAKIDNSSKKESVNINLQTLLAIIPYVQLYSAYRIKKFRQFFLLWVAIGVGTAFVYFFTLEQITGLSHIIGIPFYIILIRKWSKEWNEQLSNNVSNNQDDDVSSKTPLG